MFFKALTKVKTVSNPCAYLEKFYFANGSIWYVVVLLDVKLSEKL